MTLSVGTPATVSWSGSLRRSSHRAPGYNPRDYPIQANAFVDDPFPSALLRTVIATTPDVEVTFLASRLGVPEHLVRVGLAQALFCSPPQHCGSSECPLLLPLTGRQNDALLSYP